MPYGIICHFCLERNKLLLLGEILNKTKNQKPINEDEMNIHSYNLHESAGLKWVDVHTFQPRRRPHVAIKLLNLLTTIGLQITQMSCTVILSPQRAFII